MTPIVQDPFANCPYTPYPYDGSSVEEFHQRLETAIAEGNAQNVELYLKRDPYKHVNLDPYFERAARNGNIDAIKTLIGCSRSHSLSLDSILHALYFAGQTNHAGIADAIVHWTRFEETPIEERKEALATLFCYAVQNENPAMLGLFDDANLFILILPSINSSLKVDNAYNLMHYGYTKVTSIPDTCNSDKVEQAFLDRCEKLKLVHSAIAQGYIDFLDLLIQIFRDRNRLDLLWAQSSDGPTPLHQAVITKQEQAVCKLIPEYPLVNLLSRFHDKTALELAEIFRLENIATLIKNEIIKKEESISKI